jgi:hypothetical protein
LSDGEFVVRASQTAKHLDLLHALNRGEIAAFASGGLVGKSGLTAPAMNDNLRAMNDNRTSVTINAPVTVNGSAGTEAQNTDLARKMAKEVENTMRGVVADELRRQMRPGNLANNRSR